MIRHFAADKFEDFWMVVVFTENDRVSRVLEYHRDRLSTLGRVIVLRATGKRIGWQHTVGWIRSRKHTAFGPDEPVPSEELN